MSLWLSPKINIFSWLQINKKYACLFCSFFRSLLFFLSVHVWESNITKIWHKTLVKGLYFHLLTISVYQSILCQIKSINNTSWTWFYVIQWQNKIWKINMQVHLTRILSIFACYRVASTTFVRDSYFYCFNIYTFFFFLSFLLFFFAIVMYSDFELANLALVHYNLSIRLNYSITQK